jgi:hypothetical protein
MRWLDTRHKVFTYALSFLIGVLVVELVLPDGFAWWQRVLFGWMPVGLLIEQGLARYMGWAEPLPEEPRDEAPVELVSYEPIGRPDAARR